MFGNCGCNDSFMWIIFLLILCGGCGQDNKGGCGCGGDNNFIWLLFLIIICCGCGGNEPCNKGCC